MVNEKIQIIIKRERSETGRQKKREKDKSRERTRKEKRFIGNLIIGTRMHIKGRKEKERGYYTIILYLDEGAILYI